MFSIILPRWISSKNTQSIRYQVATYVNIVYALPNILILLLCLLDFVGITVPMRGNIYTIMFKYLEGVFVDVPMMYVDYLPAADVEINGSVSHQLSCRNAQFIFLYYCLKLIKCRKDKNIINFAQPCVQCKVKHFANANV